MLTSSSFSNLSRSILYAPISSYCAPIAQLIVSHARLLGRRGGHPVWAQQCIAIKDIERGGQFPVGAGKAKRAKRRAGFGRWWLLRSHGDLARGRVGSAEADGAIARVVFGLGCGVCKTFRDGGRDTDALQGGVELVLVGCHCHSVGCWLLVRD
jgi:hypothetical protein